MRFEKTVLQVIPALAGGGAEQTTVEMTAAIVAAGGRALVATSGGRLTASAAKAGGQVFILPVASKNPLTIIANRFRLARLIRAERVDIIHARSRAPAWSALLAARAAGIPFVTTYHGAYRASTGPKRFYNSIMARGDLVSDDTIEEILTARFKQPDCRRGFILDGAVRTVGQAKMIDRVLKKQRRKLDVVIELVVDEEELVNRLNRRVEETKAAGKPVRPDDNEETFRKRQAVYRKQTAPLIPYYEKQEKLRKVDGMGTVAAVAAAIDAILDEFAAD